MNHSVGTNLCCQEAMWDFDKWNGRTLNSASDIGFFYNPRINYSQVVKYFDFFNVCKKNRHWVLAIHKILRKAGSQSTTLKGKVLKRGEAIGPSPRFSGCLIIPMWKTWNCDSRSKCQTFYLIWKWETQTSADLNNGPAKSSTSFLLFFIKN